MNKYVPAQFAQVAPFAQAARKNYRDIPNQYDSMGQQQPWFGPPPGYGMPGTGQMGGMMPGPGGLMPYDVGLQLQGIANANGGACNVPLQNNGYERPIGLPRICIGACDCETAETSVCGPFTLTGIYVAPRVAFSLSITRIQVGCNSVLVNCDPIPAELFSCCDVDENVITAPTVEANSPICIEFENESNKDLTLKAALKGIVCISCQ